MRGADEGETDWSQITQLYDALATPRAERSKLRLPAVSDTLSTYRPAGNIVPSTETGRDIVMIVFLSHSLAFSKGTNALLIRLVASVAATVK